MSVKDRIQTYTSVGEQIGVYRELLKALNPYLDTDTRTKEAVIFVQIPHLGRHEVSEEVILKVRRQIEDTIDDLTAQMNTLLS